MSNKEIIRKTRCEKIGTMARQWIHNRFGVDETPIVDQKPALKTPEVIIYDATAIEANWTYNRFGVDER